MTPELKTKWVEALRSGNYKQALGTLHPAPKCFCALGVLCDVSGFGKWDPHNSERFLFDDGDSAYACLHDHRYKFQLSPEAMLKVVTMNDAPSENKSFAEIANYIEAHI